MKLNKILSVAVIVSFLANNSSLNLYCNSTNKSSSFLSPGLLTQPSLAKSSLNKTTTQKYRPAIIPLSTDKKKFPKALRADLQKRYGLFGQTWFFKMLYGPLVEEMDIHLIPVLLAGFIGKFLNSYLGLFSLLLLYRLTIKTFINLHRDGDKNMARTLSLFNVVYALLLYCSISWPGSLPGNLIVSLLTLLPAPFLPFAHIILFIAPLLVHSALDTIQILREDFHNRSLNKKLNVIVRQDPKGVFLAPAKSQSNALPAKFAEKTGIAQKAKQAWHSFTDRRISRFELQQMHEEITRYMPALTAKKQEIIRTVWIPNRSLHWKVDHDFSSTLPGQSAQDEIITNAMETLNLLWDKGILLKSNKDEVVKLAKAAMETEVFLYYQHSEPIVISSLQMLIEHAPVNAQNITKVTHLYRTLYYLAPPPSAGTQESFVHMMSLLDRIKNLSTGFSPIPEFIANELLDINFLGTLIISAAPSEYLQSNKVFGRPILSLKQSLLGKTLRGKELHDSYAVSEVFKFLDAIVNAYDFAPYLYSSKDIPVYPFLTQENIKQVKKFFRGIIGDKPARDAFMELTKSRVVNHKNFRAIVSVFSAIATQTSPERADELFKHLENYAKAVQEYNPALAFSVMRDSFNKKMHEYGINVQIFGPDAPNNDGPEIVSAKQIPATQSHRLAAPPDESSYALQTKNSQPLAPVADPAPDAYEIKQYLIQELINKGKRELWGNQNVELNGRIERFIGELTAYGLLRHDNKDLGLELLLILYPHKLYREVAANRIYSLGKYFCENGLDLNRISIEFFIQVFQAVDTLDKKYKNYTLHTIEEILFDLGEILRGFSNLDGNMIVDKWKEILTGALKSNFEPDSLALHVKRNTTIYCQRQEPSALVKTQNPYYPDAGHQQQIQAPPTAITAKPDAYALADFLTPLAAQYNPTHQHNIREFVGALTAAKALRPELRFDAEILIKKLYIGEAHGLHDYLTMRIKDLVKFLYQNNPNGMANVNIIEALNNFIDTVISLETAQRLLRDLLEKLESLYANKSTTANINIKALLTTWKENNYSSDGIEERITLIEDTRQIISADELSAQASSLNKPPARFEPQKVLTFPRTVVIQRDRHFEYSDFITARKRLGGAGFNYAGSVAGLEIDSMLDELKQHQREIQQMLAGRDPDAWRNKVSSAELAHTLDEFIETLIITICPEAITNMNGMWYMRQLLEMFAAVDIIDSQSAKQNKGLLLEILANLHNKDGVWDEDRAMAIKDFIMACPDYIFSQQLLPIDFFNMLTIHFKDSGQLDELLHNLTITLRRLETDSRTSTAKQVLKSLTDNIRHRDPGVQITDVKGLLSASAKTLCAA